MAGFFSETALKTIAKVIPQNDGASCDSCGLFRTHKYNKFESVGEGRLGVMIILDCATPAETHKREQATTGAVQLLSSTLRKIGIDLLKDCWVVRAVQCAPSYEKGFPAPTTTQINACNVRLQAEIDKRNPTSLVTMGNISLSSLIGSKITNISVNRFRCFPIPDQDHKKWILSTFSPEYVRFYENDANLRITWERDLNFIFKFVLRAPPFPDNNKLLEKVKLVTAYPAIISLLKKVLIKKPQYFYFDYETTGLKPHADGHKIVYASFCTGGFGYSFPVSHRLFFSAEEQSNIATLLQEILIDPDITKLAHSIKFEDQWSSNILGECPSPWGLDTLLAAHIGDNRRGFTGLKFQTYMILGIAPYDGAVQGFLEADTSNGFNKLESLDPKVAMLYSALDSVYGYEIFKHYDAMFREPDNQQLRDAYTLFHNGTLTFSDIQENGICMQEEHYHKQKIELRKEIKKLEKELANSFEAQEYQKAYGKILNIDSSTELSKLLYTILKYKVEFKTDNQKPSVGKDALDGINSEFTNKIIHMRQLKKIVDTYIAQFEREVVDGKIYASYDLNIPISYRSSSSNP